MRVWRTAAVDASAAAAAVAPSATAAACGVREMVDECMITGVGGDAPFSAEVDACAGRG